MNHCVLKIIPVALVNFRDVTSNLTSPMARLVCLSYCAVMWGSCHLQADTNMLANLSSSGSEASLLNNQMKKSSKIEIGKQEAGKEGGVREKKEYNPRCTVQLHYTNHKLREAHTSPSAGLSFPQCSKSPSEDWIVRSRSPVFSVICPLGNRERKFRLCVKVPTRPLSWDSHQQDPPT